MTTILAFLFVIGVLIFVHELGHHLMAKWFGVRVLTFSLGFWAEAADRPLRRHRLSPERHPIRRIREDGPSFVL